MNISGWVHVFSTAAVSTAITFACTSDESAGTVTDAGVDADGSGAASGGGAPGTGGTRPTGGSPGAAGGPSCLQAVAVTCDGAEDCPSGQKCCGKWDQEYVEFGCFDSCEALNADAGFGMVVWFDLCHPGDACEDPAAQCLTSTYLPSSLSRCYDTGTEPDPGLAARAAEINCGQEVCGCLL
jgi:hypothetical protein